MESEGLVDHDALLMIARRAVAAATALGRFDDELVLEELHPVRRKYQVVRKPRAGDSWRRAVATSYSRRT